MARDAYGFPIEEVEDGSGPGPVARWAVPVLWLLLDGCVGVCTGAFTALAWDSPDDPQYIVLFSSPWVGGAAVGTGIALLLALWRRHPALQVIGSAFCALLAFFAFPILWFAVIVAGEIAAG